MSKTNTKRNKSSRRITLFTRGFIVACFILGGFLSAGSKNDEDKQENPRYYAQRAESFQETGSWEASKREIDDGLKYYPNDPDLRYLNGRYYYYAQGDLNTARYNLIKSIQENDQHYQAKRILVDVEDDAEHYSSSICYINELLEFQPYDRDLWRRKIALYNKIGQRQEADEALQRLARIYPNDTIIQRDLANRTRENWTQRLQKTSLNDAAAELESWLDIDPENLDYYFELVGIYYKTGQIERAIGTVNRALMYSPGNSELIRKAASMMAEMGDYTRALSFLKANGSTGMFYNQLLKEVANDNRMRDPYESNGRLYMTTHDPEALTYLINTSVVRGYYPDAIEYLQEAYRRYGDRPDLLMKQYGLEKRFGYNKKALGVLERLYRATPEDDEIKEEYADMMLTLTDHDIQTDQWSDALQHIDRALMVIQPDSVTWPAVISRKINIFTHLNQLDSARNLYLTSSAEMPIFRERFAYAYQEGALNRIKVLIEDEEYGLALREAEDLLAITGENEAALRVCINMAQTLNKDEAFRKYAAMGYEKYPNSPYFIIKEAVALQQQGKTREALALVRPDRFNDEYINPQLRNAYVGMSEELAGQLVKDHFPEEAIACIDSALMFDPNDHDLLYLKGVAYEQLKDYGKAWDYQYKYYNPTNAEQQDWQQHMRYLKWRSFENHISASYTGAYYDSNSDDLSTIAHAYSIASVSYSLLKKRDTFMGQISYKGVDGHYDLLGYESGGFGLEFLARWDHIFNKHITGFASASYGTKYFNKVGADVGASYDLLNGWVPSVKLSYRYTAPTYIVNKNDATQVNYSRYNVFFLTPGVEKSWGDRVKTSANVDLIGMKTGFYYNVGLKGKLFVNNDNVSSVGLMAGFGSFPELAFFDQTALSTLSHTNAMVGIEGMYLITNNFALSLNGNWNTYYYPVRLSFDEPMVNSYRNVFSVNLGLHVAF